MDDEKFFLLPIDTSRDADDLLNSEIIPFSGEFLDGMVLSLINTLFQEMVPVSISF